MSGLLKFLAIFILLYYLFRLIMRYVAPLLFARFVRKAQENMMGDQGRTAKTKPKKEGEVKVDYVPEKKRTGKKDNLGDYTDFEEIND